MSVRVKLPTILRTHTGGEAIVEGQGQTVRDLLDDLEGRYPGLTRSILNGGGLHRFVNLYVNGEDVRYLDALETRVNEGDTVSILPAVAGGSGFAQPRPLPLTTGQALHSNTWGGGEGGG